MKGFLKFFVVYIFVNVSYGSLLDDLVQVDPDFSKNVTEFITSYGYPIENYIVETVDGYLLSVQRIPHGRNESKATGKRPPVLLLHGATGDSVVFVWNFEDKSLGFILADNGYDVWMLNFRGNTYSRRNVKLSPDQIEFWDFSIDEKAAIDLPAVIDFVLNKTEKESLACVGYSEGNTVAFALLSLSPLYNNKINLFAAYGPIVYNEHTKKLFAVAFELFVLLQPIYKKIGFVEFFPHSTLIEQVSLFVCGTPLRFLCAGGLYALVGYDPKHLNQTRLPVYLNQYIAGDSTKTIIQYSQMRKSGKFQMFDYIDRNAEYYNQSTPPEYDVSKITTPVALYTGRTDIVADARDVDKLRRKLQSTVQYYTVPSFFWNHADFILGLDASSLLHKNLLLLLKIYSGK